MITSDNIPATLDEAVEVILTEMSTSDLLTIRDNPMAGHFGFGRWVRNNWGLWSGSVLQDWFLSNGIWHADDMWGLIDTAVWAKIRNEEFNFDKEKEKYYRHWEKAGLNNIEELEKVKGRKSAN